MEQYKKRITHKKASIEAQLKSAVQGKLDGVSVGLKQLQECLEDVQQVSVKYVIVSLKRKNLPVNCISSGIVELFDSHYLKIKNIYCITFIGLTQFFIIISNPSPLLDIDLLLGLGLLICFVFLGYFHSI